MTKHNKSKQPVATRLLAIGTVSLLSIALVLGGCAVGPDFVKPEVSVRENWGDKGDPRVLTQAAVNTQWWKAFNDPALDRLIQLAYQQNLPLQIAGLRILEARARLGIAIGEQYPQQQEFTAGVTGVGMSKNAADSANIDRNNWDYQIGFDASWELDFWGKLRRGVESESAVLIASVAEYDNVLVSLTAEVARTYAAIRTFEVLIDQAQENARIQKEGLGIARSRFRNGATSELDVTQAVTLLESTLASIPQLQISLWQAQNALSTLLGQPTGAIQALLERPRGIPTAPAEVAVSVPAEMLRRRPDIRSAEFSAAAQCARIGIAEADLYPSFYLFGEIGFQTSSQGGAQSRNAQFDDLFDSSSMFYSFGPRVNWPFFNYGRIENNVRVQDARFQQLMVNYQNTVLKAAQEVEDALIGFLKSQEAAAFEQKSVSAARQSVKLALAQYREGTVDFQRVLDGQRSLLQQENDLAQMHSAIATNLIALYKALGGGWELRQNQPIVSERTQTEMQKRIDWGNLLPAQPAPEYINPLPAKDIPIVQAPVW